MRLRKYPLLRLNVVASNLELHGHLVPVDVLDVAEPIAVPIELYTASLLPAWQLAFAVHHLLLMSFELLLVVKMGAANLAHNDEHSVCDKFMLDGQPTSLLRSVTVRAEPHMWPSGLTTEIFGEDLEVYFHHIIAEHVTQDRGFLVPIVMIGSIFGRDFGFRFFLRPIPGSLDR